MSFWEELKRRNVYKVGVAYVIVAWLLIQAASIILPHLNLPTWAVPFVIIILIIGFPIVLIIAWAFEVTPEGIKRTKDVPLSESITHLTGRKLNYILVGVIVLALAYIVFDKLYIDRSAPEITQVPAVSEEVKAKKTIAVLPFVDISPDKDQEYFVDGLSEELLNSLAQIPDLTVIARTSSFTFKNSDKKVQEIASELGVDNILEGSVRKAGNDLRITAQLVKGEDGSHLWSKTYDRKLKDIFAVQEDIATTVASELKATLGIGQTLKQMGGTDNEEAYELYLIAKALYREGPLAVSKAIEPIKKAVELDPEFALAWALKSNIHHGFFLYDAPDAIAEINEGLNAAERAIELEPDLAYGYYSLGNIKTDTGQWTEAELAYRRALELLTEHSLRYQIEYPIHYTYVGLLEKAKEIYEGQIRIDPLNLNVRGLYISLLGVLGNEKQIEKEFERGITLFGEQWETNLLIKGYTYNARISTGDATYRHEILYNQPFPSLKEHDDSSDDILTELRRIYADESTIGFDFPIHLMAAYFGDPEFAMDVIEKNVGLPQYMPVLNYLWSPVMHEVRQLPRFKEFVKEIGLVDYWDEFGWPDICHQLDNGDFECD